MELFHSPIPIPMEDEIVHTLARPTCDDPDCPCWQSFYEAEARAEQAYIERGFMSYSQLPELRDSEEDDDARPPGNPLSDDTTLRYRHHLYYATLPEAERAFEVLDEYIYEILVEMETVPMSQTRGVQLRLVTSVPLTFRDEASILSLVHPQAHSFNTREETIMSDPFESLQPEDFQAALDPVNWEVTTTLHTKSFEATLTADTQLALRRRGGEEANTMAFSGEEVRALTRFLVNNVRLEPEEPPYDFKDFHPQRLDTQEGGD